MFVCFQNRLGPHLRGPSTVLTGTAAFKAFLKAYPHLSRPNSVKFDKVKFTSKTSSPSHTNKLGIAFRTLNYWKLYKEGPAGFDSVFNFPTPYSYWSLAVLRTDGIIWSLPMPSHMFVMVVGKDDTTALSAEAPVRVWGGKIYS